MSGEILGKPWNTSCEGQKDMELQEKERARTMLYGHFLYRVPLSKYARISA